MTIDQITIFAILFMALVLFVWDKWRYDIVALFVLFVSVIVGVVPAEKAFTGFSDPVVTTVAAILIISAAIGRSGFIDLVMKAMGRVIDKPKMQITLLVAMVMVLSAFMNNVGALAVFLPIALTFARKANRKPSELLMPLSFGSLLGGLITMIGTPPNLLISRIREDMAGEPFQMFDFAPVGLGLCALGLVYLSFGWKLLPTNRQGKPSAEDSFAIEDYISEVLVKEDSTIVNKMISTVEGMVEGDLTIYALIRGNDRRPTPSGLTVVKEGDILLLRSDPVSLKSLVDIAKVELIGSKETADIPLTSDDVGTVEAVITSDSELVNATARQLALRSRFGVNILAIRKQSARGKAGRRLSTTQFHSGDVIVLQGNMDVMPQTLADLGCLPLAERNLMLGRPKQLYVPMLILSIAVLLTIFGVMPISIAFLGGVLALAIMRIMRLNEIYEAIDWPVIMLLGAMIPVTQALQTTGGSELIAVAIASVSEGFPAYAMVGLIILASMLVTPFLNNAATVLLMAPIAGSLAYKMGVNIDPFLMAVAVGTSCDFLTPIGHQSNTLVMGPGGYKFNDYWRLGLPLSIMVLVAGTALILMIWPLH